MKVADGRIQVEGEFYNKLESRENSQDLLNLYNHPSQKELSSGDVLP